MEYRQKTIKYKGKIVFEKLNLPYFTRIPKEYFEKEACFIFVNEGAFTVRSQTETTHFEKGTGLLAKCLNYFFETNSKQRMIDEGVEVIAVVIYPELVRDLFQFDIAQSNHRVNFNLKKIQVTKLLHHFKESINLLIENPELADEQLIKNKLREFVMLMSKNVDSPSQLDFLAAMFKPTFAKFEEVIQSNYNANLTLNEWAALCHLSLSSFKRQFKKVYGQSPKKHIAQLRIERAKEMLQNKEKRISDIAYDLGFESLTTFNRTFKEYLTLSPSEFRGLI